jgi:hypothetical protein
MIATLDTDALLQLVWVAPLAVATVTVAYGLLVIGTVRAVEARRDGRGLAAGAFVAVAVAGAVLFGAAIVFGLTVMISKG